MLRPLIQPVLERGFDGSPFARGVAGVDPAELLAAGRELLEETAAHEPASSAGCSPSAGRTTTRRRCAYAVGYLVPARPGPAARASGAGPGRAARTTMETWLGRPLEADPSLESLVLRYLGRLRPGVASWTPRHGPA